MRHARLSATLSAQWPSFVRQDTPRTSEGKPDLDAPPPRLPNGKIDFSGTWESRQSAERTARRTDGAEPDLPTDPPLASFANIGQNIKEGLPFTPWAAELRKQRMATNSKENPDANCLPIGFMQLHTHSQPRKVVQTVNDLVIMYEVELRPSQHLHGWPPAAGRRSAAVVVRLLGRQIRRRHAGRRTIGLRDEGWLDVNGAPFTTARRSPSASGVPPTAGWKSTSHRRREGVHAAVDRSHQLAAGADEELIEFVCNENNLDVRHLR